MRVVAFALWFASCASAQSIQAGANQTAQLAQLNFLLGTWSAQTIPMKGAPAQALGEYTFRTDLLKHVVTRVSDSDNCASAKSLDCQHYDSLTVYADPGDPVLHALYLDSQGHTIHYNLAFPDASTAIFFSTGAGTQTRLVYHIQKNILTGKLQTAPQGSTDFTSTLDWFGVRMIQNEPQAARPASPHALDSLANNTRILFVFASQSADPRFQQQIAALAGHDREFADRNLILIPVLARWTIVDKDLFDRNAPFSAMEEQKYARRRYKAGSDAFTVVLVGKDGEEKMRSHVPLSAHKLFEMIDAMPMRKQEMRKR